MADDEVPITTLVIAAAEGNEAAWSEIVERYSPLLVGVLRQCRLTPVEIDDVAQTVWLRLVEHLVRLREARALPMWIITTGRREAWRHAAIGRRYQLRDPEVGDWAHGLADQADPDEELLRTERQHALLAGLAELGRRDRQLLLMLMDDPPMRYAEISRRTGIPVGGIGPTRARALDKLRRSAAIQAMLASDSDRREPVAQAEG